MSTVAHLAASLGQMLLSLPKQMQLLLAAISKKKQQVQRR